MKRLVITEDEKKRILGLYEIVGEKLKPEVLNSKKAKHTKNYAQFLNSHYKINLPAATTGSWTDKDYNDYLKKFMEENNIPVWVCKTGDGWCPDNSDGEVTTKSNDLWKKFVKPFFNKDMSGGTVDNQETSTNNFTKDMADMLNIDEYYLKFMELPIPVHAQNNPQNYLKERYTELTQKMRENIKQEPDAAKTFFEKLTNITKYQNSLNSQQKFFLNSLASYYPKLITPTTVNITQNPKDLEKIKSQMNNSFGNLSQDKLNLIKQGINKVNQQDDVY
jgi:hypothetical protein